MTAADELDILFTSSYTLATPASDSVPCDFRDEDQVQQVESGVGGVTLNSKSLLVRTSAFPELADGDPVIVTDDDGVQQGYIVRGAPMRIQDGQVMQVNLEVDHDVLA